jgi:hypothetical protein
MSFNSLSSINTCLIETKTKDKWGNIISTVISAPQPCRIVYSNRIVRDFKGQEVVSTATIFFRKAIVIVAGQRLFFDNRWHGIQKIGRPQNSTAIHHREVWVD